MRNDFDDLASAKRMALIHATKPPSAIPGIITGAIAALGVLGVILLLIKAWES